MALAKNMAQIPQMPAHATLMMAVGFSHFFVLPGILILPSIFFVALGSCLFGTGGGGGGAASSAGAFFLGGNTSRKGFQSAMPSHQM